MPLSDILVNERSCLVASFLGPREWPALRRVSRRTTQELCPAILQFALVEMLSHTVAQLALVTIPTQNSFKQLEDSLQLLIKGDPALDAVAPTMVAELTEIVCCWLGVCSPLKLKSADAEIQKVHKPSRVWFRGMDHKLWIAAVHEYPQLYPRLCRIISTWPLNYKDRDLLLKAGAAALPALADPANPKNVVIGFQLGVKLSCGSEERVALLEGESLSAKSVEALKRFENDEDVIVYALAYLNNVAQCEEQWPTLAKLDVGPICRRALDLLKNHPQLQEYGHHILDVLSVIE